MAELYKFTDGHLSMGFSPQLFRETWEGVVYNPTPVSRSALSLSGNLVRSQVTFTFPSTDSFAKRRVFDLPGIGWKVQIYEDKVLLWTGRVISATLLGSKINILTDSTERSDLRSPTGARFAFHCWKTLYSETCGANKAGVVTNLTVTTLDKEVILPADQILNNFAGGIIERNISGAIESRRIVRNAGNTLWISSPFTVDETGLANLYPGCNLTSSDCLKFNNLDNFGGFEHIPLTNPMERTGLL